jgi:hypothetical protein
MNTKKYSYKDVIYIESQLKKEMIDKNVFVEVSADDEYFCLVDENRAVVYGDSANTDLYDINSAIAAFNSYIESI